MEIRKVAVLGAGTMGHGIAQVCAQAGMKVALRDVDDAALERGLTGIRGSLDRLVQKTKIDAAAREQALAAISRTTDLAAAVADADLVVEAIPERMELKLSTFAEVDRHAPAHALLGTNTSSLSVTEIAGATKRPERVVGLHFFNPVPVMELLEIVRGLRTGDEAIAAARAFATAIGKRPIVVSFGNPYLLQQVRTVPAYLIGWGGFPVSQQAAARALLGSAPIVGRLPIAIPPVAPLGAGLRRGG